MAQNPLVYILILHFRVIENTVNCLESLKGLDYSNHKILLVDNGSENNEGANLKTSYPNLEILVLERNLGFSGGCNKGIEYCLSRGADYVWLLNNDTIVPENTLGLLVEAMQNDTKAGAAGAALLVFDEKTGEVKGKTGKGQINFRKGKTLLKEPELESNIQCQWLSGSNLLLRAKTINEVGKFNDDYFLYFEDVDLCHRIKSAGWTLLLVPGARIKHLDGASTKGNLASWRNYYYARNRLYFFSLHTQGIGRLICLSSIFLHMARRLVIWPFSSSEKKKLLQAEYLGTWHFLQNKRGQANLF